VKSLVASCNAFGGWWVDTVECLDFLINNMLTETWLVSALARSRDVPEVARRWTSDMATGLGDNEEQLAEERGAKESNNKNPFFIICLLFFSLPPPGDAGKNL
jgi:hypothetical protein